MKRNLVALVTVALFLAGACGDDDKTDVSSTGTTVKGATTTIDTSFSGKGSGDFCSVTKRFTEKFKDQKNATTPAEVKAQFAEITDAIDKMASEAPSEIKADAKFLKEAFDEANDLYEKYDYDFSKVSKDPAAEKLKMNSPELGAASTRLESYMEKVCKIDADEDGDTDGVIDNDGSGTSDDSGSSESTTTSAP